MQKILVFLFFHSLCNLQYSYAVLPNYSKNVTIKVELNFQEKIWEEHVLLITPENQEGSEIELRGDGNFYIIDKDLQLYADFWGNVTKLDVVLESEQHPLLKPTEIVRLDTMQVLQKLPVKLVEFIEIDLSKYFGNVDIALEKWNHYQDWKQSKLLTSFVLKLAEFRPQFEIQSLFGFPLKELVVPCFLSQELLEFPELENLKAFGVYSNFTQQLVSLEKLCLVEEYGNRYSNAFETLHAERYYRTLLELQFHGDWRCESPFKELVSMTGFNTYTKKGRFKKNYDIVYFENDFPQYSGNTPQNDTLLVGKVKRYKSRGLWSFKLKDQYPRNDREVHHIDFDNLPKLQFPETGHWSLEYANGKTAIEGRFENGRKNGEWRYYNEDGSLRSTKLYENDTLIFSKVQFNLHGNILESRTFYVSIDEIYQSLFLPDEQKLKLNVLYFDGYGMPYRFSEYGVVEFRERNRMYAQTYVPGSEKYEKVIRKGIIDKLFPEYIGQELPFTVGR